jgi:peroxiredoxin
VKRIFLIAIALATLTFACKKHSGFVIKGKITNSEGKYLYLEELKVSSSVPVDSVKLGKNGTFQFKGKIGYPNFYLLSLTKNNFVTLLVDTIEHISVYSDAANFAHEYVVEGSSGSTLVQQLNNMLSRTKHRIDSIRSCINALGPREEYSLQREKWNQEIIDIKQNQIRYSTDFIQKHPFSMACVLALYQKFDDSNYVVQDLQSLKIAASALNSFFPKSEHVKALYANTMRLMANEKNDRMQKFIEKNGVNSPDIKLPDVTGQDVSLSSLKSKAVLIQFWSALNRDSRIQNQALVELYHKYKSRGLEIYQVSVDTIRSAWTNAIIQDGLTWVNVGDMKGSLQAINNYNVQTVPENYILDKEKRIVAKNKIGPELDQIIGTTLKQ